MRIAAGFGALALLVLAGCTMPGGSQVKAPPASPSAPVTSAAPTSPATPVEPDAPGTPEGDGELVPDGLTDAIPDLTATPKAPIPAPVARLYGADVSWPQCPKGMGIPQKRSQGAPMPTAAAKFVVIGLTNGPSFYPNPCIADQVAWARARKVMTAAYAVVSYPDNATVRKYGAQGPYDAKTRLGALSNVGYQAALFNLDTMKNAGLPSPVIWIDVEPVNQFEWSSDLAANAAVVQGTAKGYADAGYRVGFYSTPHLWKRIVGNLRTGVPEWRAAGQTSEAEALRRCRKDWSIQGGPGILGQWVEAGRDRNVACPGAIVNPSTWFGTP